MNGAFTWDDLKRAANEAGDVWWYEGGRWTRNAHPIMDGDGSDGLEERRLKLGFTAFVLRGSSMPMWWRYVEGDVEFVATPPLGGVPNVVVTVGLGNLIAMIRELSSVGIV